MNDFYTRGALALVLGGGLAPPPVQAQTPPSTGGYPAKAVRIVAGFARAGVPRAIIDRLNAETGRAVNEPDVKTSIPGQGIEPAVGTPEDHGKYVAAELHKYARVAQDAGIKIE